MSVRISTPRMTTEPSIRLWEERIFGLINSLTGLLTVLMAPRPSRELPPPQVPANWAVLRILAQSHLFKQAACRARVQNLTTHLQARLQLLHSTCNSCIAYIATTAFLLPSSFG